MRFTGSAAFLLSLTMLAAAQAPGSIWDGVFTEAQATRGAAAYAASCANCHGGDLGGGEMAPALRGGEFAANWNTVPLADLMDRIYGTMPANAPKTLSRDKAVDILAFLLRSGGFPAGAAELSPEPNSLQQITFVATMP